MIKEFEAIVTSFGNNNSMDGCEIILDTTDEGFSLSNGNFDWRMLPSLKTKVKITMEFNEDELPILK